VVDGTFVNVAPGAAAAAALFVVACDKSKGLVIPDAATPPPEPVANAPPEKS
jgi:hypothetical protein